MYKIKASWRQRDKREKEIGREREGERGRERERKIIERGSEEYNEKEVR